RPKISMRSALSALKPALRKPSPASCERIWAHGPSCASQRETGQGPPMTLPTIVSFWHGPMSWLEALCIAAFHRHGHRVEVFAFDPVEGLPTTAVWRDAAELMPREDLVFYKGKGTPAVFSDRFRLE